MLQCYITIKPKLSYHACLFGNLKFNYNILVVPGTNILAHETPQERPKLTPHEIKDLYIGPSKEHYRRWKLFLCLQTQLDMHWLSIG